MLRHMGLREWRLKREVRESIARIPDVDVRDRPTYVAYGEREVDDGRIGLAVLVDGHHVLDGRLQLALEAYELSADTSASCTSELDVKAVLMALGAHERSAAETARRLWRDSGLYSPDT